MTSKTFLSDSQNLSNIEVACNPTFTENNDKSKINVVRHSSAHCRTAPCAVRCPHVRPPNVQSAVTDPCPPLAPGTTAVVPSVTLGVAPACRRHYCVLSASSVLCVARRRLARATPPRARFGIPRGGEGLRQASEEERRQGRAPVAVALTPPCFIPQPLTFTTCTSTSLQLFKVCHFAPACLLHLPPYRRSGSTHAAWAR